MGIKQTFEAGDAVVIDDDLSYAVRQACKRENSFGWAPMASGFDAVLIYLGDDDNGRYFTCIRERGDLVVAVPAHLNLTYTDGFGREHDLVAFGREISWIPVEELTDKLGEEATAAALKELANTRWNKRPCTPTRFQSPMWLVAHSDEVDGQRHLASLREETVDTRKASAEEREEAALRRLLG